MRRLALALCVAMGCGGNRDAPPADAFFFDGYHPPDAYELPLEVGTISISQTGQGSTTTLRTARFTRFLYGLLRKRDADPCDFQFRETYGTSSSVDAGTLRIVSGTSTFQFAKLNVGVGYATDTSSGSRYAAGASLTVTATGATVPAFTGMITFPASLAVSSPPASVSPLIVSKQGLTATWSPTSGPVRVLIVQQADKSHQTTIECVFDGAAGTATLGPIALAPLLQALPDTDTIVTITTFDRRTVTAGDYEVAIEAEFVGLRRIATVE